MTNTEAATLWEAAKAVAVQHRSNYKSAKRRLFAMPESEIFTGQKHMHELRDLWGVSNNMACNRIQKRLKTGLIRRVAWGVYEVAQ